MSFYFLAGFFSLSSFFFSARNTINLVCFVMAFLLTRTGRDGSSDESHSLTWVFLFLAAGRVNLIWFWNDQVSNSRFASLATEVLVTTQYRFPF